MRQDRQARDKSPWFLPAAGMVCMLAVLFGRVAGCGGEKKMPQIEPARSVSVEAIADEAILDVPKIQVPVPSVPDKGEKPEEKYENEQKQKENGNAGELSLIRTDFTENSTIGELYINGEFFCHTLELPYRDNEENRSCIPVGNYGIKPRTSQEYGQHYLVTETEPRDLILFHVGNYPKDTEGCILVGDTKARDFVGDSKRTMKGLLEKLKGYDALRLAIKASSEK